MKMKVNHFGVSGGKDSTALMLWAIHESGYPKDSLLFTFADTGNESPETLSYIEYLCKSVHPIETIQPELDYYELAIKKRRFPSAKARFCTTELKLKPLKVMLDRLILETGNEFLLHSGIRSQESKARSKMEEYYFDTYFDCEGRRPLINWSLDDVWAMHKKYGIRRNPLYDRGMTRVGCYPCHMNRKSEIAKIVIHDPERIDFLREKEALVVSPDREGGSTFFTDIVPERYRSRTWKNKDGVEIKLNTIDDVAKWAVTSSDAWQETLDFAGFEEDIYTCPSMLGSCE
jgi:3'-phosphoadenosine 5'-phosphosulfate sulfotransferase (PAPS reductase)/FAD synthetase